MVPNLPVQEKGEASEAEAGSQIHRVVDRRQQSGPFMSFGFLSVRLEVEKKGKRRKAKEKEKCFQRR